MDWISKIETLNNFGELDRYLKGDLWHKNEQIFQALCRKYSELIDKLPEPKFKLGSKKFYLALISQWNFETVQNLF